MKSMRRVARGLARAYEREGGENVDEIYSIEDADISDEERVRRFTILLQHPENGIIKYVADVIAMIPVSRMGEGAGLLAETIARSVYDDQYIVFSYLPNIMRHLADEAEPAIPILSEALEADDTRTRIQSLQLLEATGPLSLRVLPTLLELLFDPDEDIRWHAVEAIDATESESPEVVRALAGVLEDSGSSRNVSASAAACLGRMKRPPVEALEALIVSIGIYNEDEADGSYHSQSEMRRWSAHALATIGTPGKAAIPQLIRLLEDDSDYVKVAAAKALGRMGTEAREALPKLRQTNFIYDWMNEVYAHAAHSIEAADIKTEEGEGVNP